MTRIVGDPECPICHAPADRDVAFFPEYTDGLNVDPVYSMFHQPAFHWSCYYAWPDRESFASILFDRHVTNRNRSTLHGKAYRDDDIAVFAWVCEPLDITIILRQTGRSLCASQEEWVNWQNDPTTIAPHCHDNERRFLALVLPRVWRLFPDRKSFVSHTEWTNTERHLYADT